MCGCKCFLTSVVAAGVLVMADIISLNVSMIPYLPLVILPSAMAIALRHGGRDVGVAPSSYIEKSGPW